MARPTKTKIDYFPIDCTGDDRMKLVELKHGLVAYAVYVKLLQKIYGNKGYYIEWNEDSILLFSGEYAIDSDTVTDIVSDMLRRDIFDREMYEKHSILTSKDIQEQYFFVISRRKEKDLDERYCLINLPKKEVIAKKTGVIVTKTGVSDDNNPHSIGEYSKVEDSISEESIGDETKCLCSEPDTGEHPKSVNTPAPTPDRAYGEFNNVILSDSEYEELSKRFDNTDASIAFPSTWRQQGKAMPLTMPCL